MNVPFRRRAQRVDESPVESALRRSLAAHAFETPDADDLTRRLLAAADDEPERLPAVDRPRRPVTVPSERRPWTSWGLPLVAAACVAAVVGVGAVVASLDEGHGHRSDAASHGATVAPTPHTSGTAASHTASPSATYGTGTSGLKNVKIIDLTFFHTDAGVALASAHCLGGPGRCTALLQTTDGRNWYPKGGDLGFDVNGIAAGCPPTRCVEHIRFANDQDGYAYGPSAFFVTTDGGNHWRREPGGAQALETLDGNVLRVTSQPAACETSCHVAVETAAIASTSWKAVPLPDGAPVGDGVQLSRGHGYTYLLVTEPRSGAAEATSVLYRSSDDGAMWTAGGDPCAQNGSGPNHEVDAVAVAAGTGAAVTVLCSPYGGVRQQSFVTVSQDGGQTFHARGARLDSLVGAADQQTRLAGSPSTVLAVVTGGVSLSYTGGRSWAPAADLVGTFASVGFESASVGRAVTRDGKQIWTTRNAGKSWTRSTP